MGDRIEDIKSIDELRKAQAASQLQGSNNIDYNRWEQLLENFDTAGIQSTGSYEGDVRLHEQIIDQLEEYVQETQETQRQQEMKAENNDTTKLDEKTSRDKEQTMKANVANATSSTIMADYMKYYHML